MKKLFAVIFTVLIIGGVLILDSCKKDNPPTALEITVVDNIGNPSIGASVRLYASQSDWSNGTNQVGITLYTSVSGRVRYSNLLPIQYYWFIENGCLNNSNGASTTSALMSNATTAVPTVLGPTGAIEFINNSLNPYRVYINGSFAFDLDGGYSQTMYDLSTGNYVVRVLQLSGYAIYPTDISWESYFLACGVTAQYAFPDK